MEMNTLCTDRNLILRLTGELDHHAVRPALRDLERAIEAALPRGLIVDFSAVTFMDSSGIAFILRAQKQMEHLGGSMLLCNVPQQAKRVLDAAGVSRLVVIR